MYFIFYFFEKLFSFLSNLICRSVKAHEYPVYSDAQIVNNTIVFVGNEIFMSSKVRMTCQFSSKSFSRCTFYK